MKNEIMKKLFSIVSPPTFHLAPRSLVLNYYHLYGQITAVTDIRQVLKISNKNQGGNFN